MLSERFLLVVKMRTNEETIPNEAVLHTLQEAAPILSEQFKGIGYQILRKMVDSGDLKEGIHYVDLRRSTGTNRRIRIYIPAVIEYLKKPSAFRAG